MVIIFYSCFKLYLQLSSHKSPSYYSNRIFLYLACWCVFVSFHVSVSWTLLFCQLVMFLSLLTSLLCFSKQHRERRWKWMFEINRTAQLGLREEKHKCRDPVKDNSYIVYISQYIKKSSEHSKLWEEKTTGISLLLQDPLSSAHV